MILDSVLFLVFAAKSVLSAPPEMLPRYNSLLRCIQQTILPLNGILDANPSKLRAECQAMINNATHVGVRYTTSILDLNRCFKNDAGVITPQKDGNFAAYSECTHCQLSFRYEEPLAPADRKFDCPEGLPRDGRTPPTYTNIWRPEVITLDCTCAYDRVRDNFPTLYFDISTYRQDHVYANPDGVLMCGEVFRRRELGKRVYWK